jgi:hypothetical protein
MKNLLTYLILLIVAAGCGETEFKQSKRTDAIVYNTNRYHIGRGLYEHTTMYTYAVDSVEYYGEFISKDWTRKLTSDFEISDILTIEYDVLSPKESKFIRNEGNYNSSSYVKIKLK